MSLPAATGRFRVDLPRRSVEREDGRTERLTTLEVALLGHLMGHADRVVSRDELLAEVWGYAGGAVSRAVDHTVRRLRVKVELDPSDPEHLLTVHGDGYRWVDATAFPPEHSRTPEPAPAPEPGRRLHLRDRVVDLGRARVESADGVVPLTGSELTLLEQLRSAAGASVDRGRLQRLVWGGSRGRALENAVYRLRRKLEPDPSAPTHLLTTPDGYRLELSEPTAPTPERAAFSAVPAELDERFGRDDEVAAALAALDDDLRRCVCLVGAGGIGKTRVAGAVARGWAAERRPVALVDLSGATSVDAAIAATAAALRVPLVGDRRATDQVTTALDAVSGTVLVVLDNVEQLVPELATTLAAWLAGAPRSRFLLTSRRPTGVAGEQRFPLGPLPSTPSTALFLARAVRPPAADDPALPALVEGLGGSPLALELAAARTAVLGVAALVARLDAQLALLKGGAADRPERHRSLRASLAVSWELTSPAARSALSQLTVFAGRFRVEDAEAVLHLEPADGWAIDVLQELLEASLLEEDASGGLRLQVPVREFAAENAAPLALAHAEERHGRWVAHLARAALDGLDGPEEAEALASLSRVRDELAVALPRAVARGDHAVATPTALGAWATVRITGPYPLGVALLDRAATVAPADVDLALARVEAALATTRPQDAVRLIDAIDPTGVVDPPGRCARAVTYWRVRSAAEAADRRFDDAADSARRAVAVARSGDDPASLAWALLAQGELAIDRHDVSATMAEALEWASAAGGSRLEARARRYLGWTRLRHGDRERGAADLERARCIALSLGDRWLAGQILLNTLSRAWIGRPGAAEQVEAARREFTALGDLRGVIKSLSLSAAHHSARGDLELAEATHLEALALARRLASPRAEVEVLKLLGSTQVTLGRFAEGERTLRLAIEGLAAEGLTTQVHTTAANLARALRRQGRHPEARAIYDAALAWFRENKLLAEEAQTLQVMGVQHRELGELDHAEERWSQSRHLARRAHLPHLEASSALYLAQSRSQQGDPTGAATLAGEAAALFREAGDPKGEQVALDVGRKQATTSNG